MRRFLVNSLVFAVIAGVCILVEICTIHLAARRIRMPIPPQTSLVFLGDSHIAYGVNDSLIPHSINLARVNEPWPAIYAKLRVLIKENVDTIVIGTKIEKCYDDNADKIIFRAKGHRVLRYYPILTAEEFTMFAEKGVSWDDIDWKCFRITSYIKYLVTQTFPLDWYGGYMDLDMDKLNESIIAHQQSSQTDVSNEYGRKYTDEYIHKAFQLCKEHNVTLFFVATPLYHSNEYFNMELFETFKQQVKDKCIVLDYSNLSLPDSCYGDISHLNYRGAIVFSKLLKQDFENKVWENNQYQL